MKRLLLGGSCLGILSLCLLSSAAVILIGSVVFTESQANVEQPIAATIHSATEVVPPPPLRTDMPIGEIIVTVQNGAPSPTVPFVRETPTLTESPWITATPGPAGFGTDTYILTANAEVVANRTTSAERRGAINATRTAIADESMRIFSTLTAQPTGEGTKP